jgi:hypothetical protein
MNRFRKAFALLVVAYRLTAAVVLYALRFPIFALMVNARSWPVCIRRERVRATVSLDCCDRRTIAFAATTAGISQRFARLQSLGLESFLNV